MSQRSLLVLALLLAAAPARADLRTMSAPGPLAAAHAALDDQCDRCHIPWKGVPDSGCLSCHTATARRIESGQGTHAAFSAEKRRCASCHGDHKGRAHALSPEPERPFDHRKTGFLLDGAHARAACAGCHRATASGNKWVGLSTACAACHADPHKGALGDRCLACHTSVAWKPPTRTVDEHRLPMTGGHDRLACVVCHRGGKHLASISSCGDCHGERHGGTSAPCARCHTVEGWKAATFQHDFCTCILPGKHQSAPCLSCHPAFRFRPTTFACAGCHEKDRKHEELGACSRCHTALSWKAKAFDHNTQTPFKLEGKHLEVTCINCHKQKGSFSGLKAQCASCHKVPRHGDFGACDKCHSVESWKAQSFTHDHTRFPLDGRHAGVACDTCHARIPRTGFVPGPGACVECHRDPHGGQFGAPVPPEKSGFRDGGPGSALRTGVLLAEAGGFVVKSHGTSVLCEACHTSGRWKPSSVDAQVHARFPFALRGAHVRVACARCHSDGDWVGPPSQCSACHLDGHGGRMGSDCARCHAETAWTDVRFDAAAHRAATGFALIDRHAGLACARCHGVDRRALAGKKVTCATCHVARHGDAFGADCRRCHDTKSFASVAFDHASTLFPLERRHRAIACTACHTARLAGARPSVECRACHDDVHAGRTLLDCAACHRPDRWNLVRYDHDLAEFPLRGRHLTTPCRDCHTNDVWTGVRRECISCHRGDGQRANLARPRHAGVSWQCIDCHRPYTWLTTLPGTPPL